LLDDYDKNKDIFLKENNELRISNNKLTSENKY